MSEPDLHVSGGAGGTTARYDDLASLAGASDELAGTLASISAQCHGILIDPNVLASAVLNPGGVARFEQALLAALDGPGGLSALSVGFGQRGIALRTAAAAYQATDQAQAGLLDALRWTAGWVTAPVAPALLAGGGLLFAGLAATDPVAASALAGYGAQNWQRLLTEHPGLVDTTIGAGPGALSWLPGIGVTDVQGAAGLLGTLYPDGRPQVTDHSPNVVDPTMTTPPGGFGDLMAALDYRNGTAHAGDDLIDVRVITHADGTTAYIVDIPGTKDMNLPGSGFNPDLNDMGTNVHVLGGDVTARQQAIAEALARAGASPTDPVMLIGHSQGGMVAAQAAHDTATGNFDYNVTHVVTAGSPIARADIPPDVQVLAMENNHDLVPHLDARDNPDRANVTTVTFDTQHGTIGENHGTTTTYLPAARQLDTSTDPSVRDYHDSAAAFLPGADATVQAKVYELTRRP